MRVSEELENFGVLNFIEMFIKENGYNRFCEEFGAFEIILFDTFSPSYSGIFHKIFGNFMRYKNYNGWSKKRTIENDDFHKLRKILDEARQDEYESKVKIISDFIKKHSKQY